GRRRGRAHDRPDLRGHLRRRRRGGEQRRDRPRPDPHESAPRGVAEVVAVNLRGTWSVSRHAARAMREQGSGGLLLQIVSNSAFTGSVGQTNYAASKAGVMGMLYAWDVELKRFDIRTNALWPIAQTDMTQVVFDN